MIQRADVKVVILKKKKLNVFKDTGQNVGQDKTVEAALSNP